MSKHNFRLTKHGLFIDDRDCKTPFSETLNDILTDLYDVVKLHESPKSILTEKEKEYLSYVIRPFRNRINYICKNNNEDGDTEFLDVQLDGNDFMAFPNFKKGTMYKGMELGKGYSLKELGL